MMNRMVNKEFAQEIAAVIRTAQNGDRLPELLKHYHQRDVAKAVTLLTDAERERLFRQLDAQTLAEIFPYLDDASRFLAELPADLAAEMIADMDTADALDMLRELPEEKKQTLAAHLDDDTRKDVRRLLAFHQEEIGSRMSGNFVCIPDTLTVCGAMNELVRQAGEHDNISTLYVVDGSGVFAGAIDLKDLIIARENDPLSGIIRRSYPYVLAHEKVEDCIDRIAEYEEDSLPVLTEDGRIAGILTAQDLVELVDDAMGDDYAKLGGLTSEEDLREPVYILRRMGADISIKEREKEIRLRMDQRPGPVSLCTGPYPGFPTDLQSVFLAAASVACGESRITETVFEARFAAAALLRQFGARIRTEGQTAVALGTYPLRPGIADAPDLRGGAALVLAGLAADGLSIIGSCRHIRRGYEDLCRDLGSLGAEICWL